MSAQITASFSFDSWDETEVLDVEGARIVRTAFVKTFTGELSATGRGEMVMAHALPGSAAYAGYEWVEGSLAGRTGAFVLRHNAVMAEGLGSSEVVVLAGSGTGDFTGLSGRASIERLDDGSHTFHLDYDLGSGDPEPTEPA
jgi:hypothetical protein